MRSAIIVVVGAVVGACSSAACSSESTPAPLVGAERGAPTTGVAADERAPSAADVHEAKVRALLAKLGRDPLELARWKGAALIDATLELDAAGTARLSYTVERAGASTATPAFELPPQRVAPVVIQKDPLDLGGLLPYVPVEAVAAGVGRYGGVQVLGHALPVPAGLGVLTVIAPADVAIDASGQPLGDERDGVRTRHRFGLVGGGLAVVVTRGLGVTTSVVADVAVTVREPVGTGAATALVGDVRRALEVLQERWGAGPKDLAIVITPGRAALTAAPGLVLVPAERVAEGGGPDSAPGGDPALSLSGLLDGLVAHHPAPKEALAFALATALAQSWWSGRAGDAPGETVLAQGFTRAAALAVVAGKGGDKAARRAQAFGLELPIQLALERGDADVVLATSDGGGLAGLKAGLFVATLQRHLGAPLVAELEARLRKASAPTLATIRAEILALAPRPDETRAVIARWLDERHLAQDVGPLRPEVLLEYFVADGAIGSLSEQLMGQLGADRLGGKALGLLAQGQELDAGLALSLLGELAAKDADPATKKWLELGSQLLGDKAGKQRAIDGLVEELGAELGIPEHDRSRLRQLSGMLLEALGEGGGMPLLLPDDEPAAPPDP